MSYGPIGSPRYPERDVEPKQASQHQPANGAGNINSQASQRYPPRLCPFTRVACTRDFCAWFVRNRVAEPDIGECAMTIAAREIRGIKFNLKP